MRSNDSDSYVEGGFQDGFALFILYKGYTGAWGFSKVLVFRKMNVGYCISNGQYYFYCITAMQSLDMIVFFYS